MLSLLLLDLFYNLCKDVLRGCDSNHAPSLVLFVLFSVVFVYFLSPRPRHSHRSAIFILPQACGLIVHCFFLLLYFSYFLALLHLLFAMAFLFSISLSKLVHTVLSVQSVRRSNAFTQRRSSVLRADNGRQDGSPGPAATGPAQPPGGSESLLPPEPLQYCLGY